MRVRVAKHGDTRRMNKQKPKTRTKMETTRPYGETCCVRVLLVSQLQRVVSGKHSFYSHFPKDRNCNICMRTKVTRALSRKRTGAAIPRAEMFGDLITADHKVLSEACESRNNHRYAVVVKDLATQWIPSYPCETKKLLKRHRRACKSAWSRQGNQKSFTQTIPRIWQSL